MELKPGYKQTEVGVIPEDWEVKQLGTFTDCTSGGTPSTLISSYWGGKIPWMSSGELHLKRVKNVEGRITDLGLNNSSTKIIPKNCILIGLAGQGKTRGTVAINSIELCTNQSVAAIFPRSSFDSEYLFHNLDARYDELRELSSGDGGRGGLNLTILKGLQIPFPSIEEQTAIATVLSDMDALLDSLDRLIAKKRDIKQAAMQELLTGKKRLPGFDGEWEVKRLGDVLTICHGKNQRNVEVVGGAYPILATGGQIGTTNYFLYDKPSVLIGRKGTIDRPQYIATPFWTVDTLFYSVIKDKNSAKFLYYRFNLVHWML